MIDHCNQTWPDEDSLLVPDSSKSTKPSALAIIKCASEPSNQNYSKMFKFVVLLSAALAFAASASLRVNPDELHVIWDTIEKDIRVRQQEAELEIRNLLEPLRILLESSLLYSEHSSSLSDFGTQNAGINILTLTNMFIHIFSKLLSHRIKTTPKCSNLSCCFQLLLPLLLQPLSRQTERTCFSDFGQRKCENTIEKKEKLDLRAKAGNVCHLLIESKFALTKPCGSSSILLYFFNLLVGFIKIVGPLASSTNGGRKYCEFATLLLVNGS
ncbi:hypothetical protein HUJ05_008844 [Dendroctonus ponderosae]|nr:hypothetical protein HUJ05_008844 [Dendroctonus ponderosae]